MVKMSEFLSAKDVVRHGVENDHATEAALYDVATAVRRLKQQRRVSVRLAKFRILAAGFSGEEIGKLKESEILVLGAPDAAGVKAQVRQ